MGTVLSVIPCRGGSKGIPRKNIRPVAGKPLLEHTVRASLDSEIVDRTIVSTDDATIASIAEDAGADVPFTRPAELATDNAAIEPVIRHAIDFLSKSEGVSYDTILLLQVTSPLRTASHIDEALTQYRESGADSLVAVYEDHSYRWTEQPDGATIVNYESRLRRQDKEPEYVESGAIYAVDVDRFVETGDLQSGKTTLFVLDSISALDIDRPFELWLADKILTEWQT